MALPVALSLLLLLAPPEAAESVAPKWVTFDVLNPEQSGQHRILHLGDVLAGRPDIPGFPAAKSLLVVTATLEGCMRPDGVCAAFGRVAEGARARGGLALLLLLDGPETLSTARVEVRKARLPFPVAFDAWAIVRRALGLTTVGEAIVLHADGRLVRLGRGLEGPSGRAFEEVERVFLRDLDRAKEETE